MPISTTLPAAHGTSPLPGAAARPAVRDIVLDAGGIRLSALLAEPRTPPRATVLAVHGGGMRAGYFHGPAHPDLSLLTLGAELGFTVLAVDRPGYGLSSGDLPEGLPLAEQTALLRRGFADFAERHSLGAGVFVLAHSYGGKTALTLAADHGDLPLLGLGISGCGYRFALEPGARGAQSEGGATPSAQDPKQSVQDPTQSAPGGTQSAADPTPDELRWRRELGRNNWGPLRLYPPDTFRLCRPLVAPMPPREAQEVPRWQRTFEHLAPRIRIPVRFTFAAYEQRWRHDPEALAALRGLLPEAAVSIDRQPAAGHNISLGWAARAYHLRLLGFLEERLLAPPGPPGPPGPPAPLGPVSAVSAVSPVSPVCPSAPRA
ncbi:alpha/beta hydrolase [Streptomyces sp. NPDC048639]|uniref:alpha/beta hydrolase n=1 Tax=Streptomyces sp. NPDC048639 TaxID=3365581 RepID=UPI00371ACBFC